MLRLLKKDLIVGWFVPAGMTLLIPMVVLLAMMAMLENFNGMIPDIFMLLVIIITLAPVLIMTSVDNRETTAPLFASLPIHRRSIVCSYHATALLLIAWSITLIFVTFWIGRHLMHLTDPMLTTLFSFKGAIFFFFFLTLITGLVLPFVIVFGAERGTTLAITAQIALILLFPLFKFVINALAGLFSFDVAFWKRLIQALLRFLEARSSFEILLMGLGLTTLVNLLSLGVSVISYQHKDL